GKRKLVPLGKDLNEAFIAWQNHESDTERISLGKAPIHDEPGLAPGRITVADAAESFTSDNLDKQAKGKLSDSSVLAYNNAVTSFRDHVFVQFIDEITREVLLDHETYLHKHLQ